MAEDKPARSLESLDGALFDAGDLAPLESFDLTTEDGLTRFYEKSKSRLLGFSRRLLGGFPLPGVDAQDLVSICMLRLLENRHQFRGDCQPMTFAVVILIHEFSRLSRKQKRKEKLQKAGELAQPAIRRRSNTYTDDLNEVVGSYLDEFPQNQSVHRMVIAYKRICIDGTISELQAQIVQLKRKGNTIEQIAQMLELDKNVIFREYQEFRKTVMKGVIYENSQYHDLPSDPYE